MVQFADSKTIRYSLIKNMRQCAKCGKGSIMVGKRKLLRGHYNPTSKSRKYPNLQFSKVEGVRKLICVQCMRTIRRKPNK